MQTRFNLLAAVLIVCSAVFAGAQNPGAKSGYSVTPYMTGLPANPTAITFDPQGSIYVLCMPGKIVRGDDTDNDKVVDTQTLVFDGGQIASFTFPYTGLTWHNGNLYLSSRGKISELRDVDGDGFFESFTHLVSGFATTNHQNNAIVFDENDQLYFAYGSLTDHGPEPTPDTATIRTCDINGNNLTTFATGLRNVYGFAYKPGFGFVAVDNGPNFLFSNLHPPDELNVVEAGKDYGFPAHYGNPPPLSGTEKPAMLFPAHSAPCGMDFNGGFSGWDTDTYVSLLVAPQKTILRCTVHKHPVTGEWSGYQDVVAFGFGSPIDCKFAPDGSLMIADHGLFSVYRVEPTSTARMRLYGTPRLGEQMVVELSDPNHANEFFGYFLSTSDAPVYPLGGGRSLNLNVNTFLFNYAFAPGNEINYFPFPGQLDANGSAFGIVNFPNYPGLAGLKIYMAWVSWSLGGQIGTTSEALPFIVQP